MMAAMEAYGRAQRRIAQTVTGAMLVLLAAAPARAQFYDLDGAYHCLTAPDDKCKNAQNPPPPLPPPPPATPSVEGAIGRIRAQQVTADDIEAIEKHAAAKEARAVEALAWCKLNGIGLAQDPVEAYLLYGEAAELGIPTAKANQSAVFQTRLTPEQRQLVLMREQTQ